MAIRIVSDASAGLPRAFCQEEGILLAPLGIHLQDELLEEMSGFFRLAGQHSVRPDYPLGDSLTQKSQLFVSYLTSDMTADAFETNYENITREALPR